MRLWSALLLLMSLMTTHAVALERAAAKTADIPAEVVAIAVIDNGERSNRTLNNRSADTPEAATTSSLPCLQNGDCLFLVPGHDFTGMGILAAHGDRFLTHAHPIRGRLIDRPPIV